MAGARHGMCELAAWQGNGMLCESAFTGLPWHDSWYWPLHRVAGVGGAYITRLYWEKEWEQFIMCHVTNLL
jgi:hypothetical protein